MQEKTSMTKQEMMEEATKVIPSGLIANEYLKDVRGAIQSASTAFENSLPETAAFYVGQAQVALDHLSAIWSTIIK